MLEPCAWRMSPKFLANDGQLRSYWSSAGLVPTNTLVSINIGSPEVIRKLGSGKSLLFLDVQEIPIIYGLPTY